MKFTTCRFNGFLLVGTLLFLFQNTAQAVLILDYTFAGNSLAPTTVHSNVAGSSLSVGNTGTGGITNFPTVNTVYFGPSGSPSIASTLWDSVDFSTADANGHYYSFTLSIDVGSQVDLTEFDLYLNSNQQGPRAYDVRYSLNGFASSLGTGVSPNQPTFPTMQNVNISLSDNSVTGDVEFRIYGYDPLNATSGGAFRVDDITLSGTAVPEPSAFLFVAAVSFLSGGAYLLKRRRPQLSEV